MDTTTKNMDILSKHWAAWPRAYPGALVVQTIGHIPHKTGWLARTFHTLNFSFILKGGDKIPCNRRVT